MVTAEAGEGLHLPRNRELSGTHSGSGPVREPLGKKMRGGVVGKANRNLSDFDKTRAVCDQDPSPDTAG